MATIAKAIRGDETDGRKNQTDHRIVIENVTVHTEMSHQSRESRRKVRARRREGRETRDELVLLRAHVVLEDQTGDRAENKHRTGGKQPRQP